MCIAGDATKTKEAMPTSVRKQSCRKASGESGNWVVYNTTTGEVYSCHSTKADAEASRRIREQSKEN